MGKPMAITSGDGPVGVRVEYVKRRRVLRLVGWHEDGETVARTLSVPEFCEELGIEAEELAAPRRYLVFAGSHRAPVGGAGDLVAAFDSEQEARKAFSALRLSRPGHDEWAEMVALDGRGQVHQLLWFGAGRGHPAGGARRRAAGEGQAGRGRLGWVRQWRGGRTGSEEDDRPGGDGPAALSF